MKTRRLSLFFWLLFITHIASVNAQHAGVLKSLDHLEGSFNSEAEEGFPLLSPDGRIYFVRTFSIENVGGLLAGQDIWYADRTNDGWSAPSNSLGRLNTRFNNAVVGVADSGRTLYLNGTYSKKYDYQVGLSVTHWKVDHWSRPKPVRIPGYNPKAPWLTYFVSDASNVILMSFARNRLGALEDIYVSTRDDKGKWSKPKTLGPDINTDSAEFSPFLSADGHTLYFSSTGLGGYGGADVFASYRLDDTWQHWSTPENLGDQVNSSRFDAYYTRFGRDAFFSSNRSGKHADIYHAQYEPSVLQHDGTMASSEYTKERMFIMKGFLQTDSLQNVKLIKILDRSGNVVQRVVPAADGSFEIKGIEKYSRYDVDFDADEKTIKDLQVFVVNENGNRVFLNQDMITGKYPFETLEKDIKAVLVADVTTDDSQMSISAFSFENGLPIPAGSTIYLCDQDSTRLESAVVNKRGEFEIKSIKLGKVYRFEFEEGTLDLNATIYLVSENGRYQLSGNILKGALFRKIEGELRELLDAELSLYGDQKNFAYNKLASQDAGETGFDQSSDAAAMQAKQGFAYNKLGADSDAELDRPKGVNDGMLQSATFGFNYGKLPPDGSKVYLVDENGNIVEEALTDANGLFKFQKLASDGSYSIRMADENDGFKDLSMYLVGSDGEQVPIAAGTKGKIEGDWLRSLYASKGEDIYAFSYKSLAPVGSKVYLTDENDNIIDSAFVDAEGNFKFKKLDPSKAYFVKMDDSDDNSKGLSYYIIDPSGRERKLSSIYEQGDTITAYDGNMSQNQAIFDKFSFDYSNLPKQGSVVYLTDANGNVIDSSFVDAAGNFRFKKLDPSMNYLFKVNDKEFDSDMASIYSVNAGVKRKLTRLAGAFVYSNMQLMYEDDTQLDASKFLMEYEGAIPNQAQAILYDEETGDMVETVEINEDGSFSFSKLDPDRRYSFKFADEIDVSKARIFSFSEEEDVKEEVVSTDDGYSFVVKPLKKLEVEDQPLAVNLDKYMSKTPNNTKGSAELSAMSPSSENGKLTLHFGFNEYMLNPDQIEYLKKEILPQLKENDQLMIEVEGHADNVGTENVNLRMSRLRISNVIYHLEMRGISEAQLKAIPKGEGSPIASNDTAEGRAKNRRVVISIIK